MAASSPACDACRLTANDTTTTKFENLYQGLFGLEGLTRATGVEGNYRSRDETDHNPHVFQIIFNIPKVVAFRARCIVGQSSGVSSSESCLESIFDEIGHNE